MCLEGFLGERISSIGHSSPQYPPQWFTSAYMGSPPPTRYHLVGQLTKSDLDSIRNSCDVLSVSLFCSIWKESYYVLFQKNHTIYHFKRIILWTNYFSANTVQRAGPWEEVQDYPDRTFDLDNCLCFCNLWVGQHYWARCRIQKCMYALIHACIPFEWWPLQSRLFGRICAP